MEEKIVNIRIVVLVVFVVIAVLVWGIILRSEDVFDLKDLTVVFFDIGQGDSIFIETPDGAQALIDGGPDSSVLQFLRREMGFFDTEIDLVVGTHPDSDHISGLIDVLEKYKVNMILTTENKSNTPISIRYAKNIREEGARVIYARAGQIFQLGASTTLTVLFPDREVSKLESNASSIVLLLRYGKTEFLFTGDLPQNIEEYMVVKYDEKLKSEVLKVGHHGSNTSSSQIFLDTVSPEYVVIQAGKNNRYGHPHKDVLDRIGTTGSYVLRTMGSGSVRMASDGLRVYVE